MPKHKRGTVSIRATCHNSRSPERCAKGLSMKIKGKAVRQCCNKVDVCESKTCFAAKAIPADGEFYHANLTHCYLIGEKVLIETWTNPSHNKSKAGHAE